MPTIIDLNAEAAKLTASRGTAATSATRKGGFARLGAYRDGILLIGTSVGTGAGHWETHPEDELIHILAGTRILEIVCDNGPPKSFPLRAGTIAVIPRGAWHRFRAVDFALVMSATIPGEHVELDVPDPRPHLRASSAQRQPAGRSPDIVDLGQEIAKLTMFRRTPAATAADRKDSVANLAPYRDGLVLAIKASGKDHWERHLAGDELVHVLDGAAILECVCDDGPTQSFALPAGTVVVIPQGAWHRLLSPEGFAQLAVTPFPGETLEHDVDDPRQVERKPA
jgi:mannose-6-phosphate isomerase-like protein (cupin superfamily)